MTSGDIAKWHFQRLWHGRNDEQVIVFANGHVYGKSERRKSVKQLIVQMRQGK